MDRLAAAGYACRMSENEAEDAGVLRHAAEIARRLVLTRRALGIEHQQDFGRAAGLSQSQYHHFESGKRRLSLEAALALCETYGLSLDWLYRGDMNALPFRLANAIRELEGKS